MRIKESSQPDASRHVEVGYPALKLSDSKQEVSKPGRKTSERGVSTFSPRFRDFVQEERVLEFFHVCSDRQFTLGGEKINDYLVIC